MSSSEVCQSDTCHSAVKCSFGRIEEKKTRRRRNLGLEKKLAARRKLVLCNRLVFPRREFPSTSSRTEVDKSQWNTRMADIWTLLLPLMLLRVVQSFILCANMFIDSEVDLLWLRSDDLFDCLFAKCLLSHGTMESSRLDIFLQNSLRIVTLVLRGNSEEIYQLDLCVTKSLKAK